MPTVSLFNLPKVIHHCCDYCGGWDEENLYPILTLHIAQYGQGNGETTWRLLRTRDGRIRRICIDCYVDAMDFIMEGLGKPYKADKNQKVKISVQETELTRIELDGD